MTALPPAVRRSRFTSISLEFQDADDRTPLARARVRVELLGADGKPAGALLEGRANAEGNVSVRIPVASVAAGQPPPLPRIRIRVFDLDGDALKTRLGPDDRALDEQDVQPEARKTITLMVLDEPQKKKLAGLIDDGTALLGRKLSPQLGSLLTQHKVNSLATLRGADPATFAALRGQDKRDLDELKAHAQLHVASRDARVNQALVKADYRSILDIARQPRGEFVAALRVQIPEATAAKLHATAQQQLMVVGAVYAEQQARRANHMPADSYGAPALETPCACDCGSALSPQAYLVDLLDYAVDNLRFEGRPITMARLESSLGQPFAALPVDCAFATGLVRQVRLCVEVLHRRNINEARARRVDAALAAYAARAYEALLRGLGTSYRELRHARADTRARERLAERLGVAPEHVDSLRLEPGSTDINRQLDEDRLERLFGLQATARDPLSTGVALGDEQGQIARWQLRGVELGKNTNDLGRIHASIVKGSGDTYEIILFKRGARDKTSRLAAGSMKGTSGEIELVAENNSGLAGRFTLSYKADDGDISLTVVPEWTIRRKSRLRELWRQADHPERVFDAPMVDPDIVTESELMQPHGIKPAYKNPAFKLWDERKTVLDERRKELGKLGSITAMLGKEFPPAINVAAWDAIAAELQSADKGVAAGGTDKVNTLGLTQQAFSFLHALAQREAANREVKAEEREQALDLLVNHYKTKKFAAWRNEEKDAKITLAAPFFVLAEQEPILNPLRASAEARASWRAELERNSVAPLIDPDIIGEANLAPGAASAPAYTMWKERRALLGDGQRPAAQGDPPAIRGSLFQALSTIDSLAKLDAALTTGNLPAGQAVLFHHIGFTAEELNTIKEALDKGTALPITPSQYGLTVAELRALFDVRRHGAVADASDWEEAHHILALAEKRRYLHPRWRREEADAGISLSPDLFHLPTRGLAEFLPLPRLTPGFLLWRLDARRQRAWRDQLQARIEQERAVELELQAAIDAAEEASLPALRDDLVQATVSANEASISLEQRKRWVLNNLLINPFESGCRKTTRVAQAIETAQLLLWGIHGGQLEGEQYTLEPDAEIFAEEWGWLGSYATWRSAIFTYLYPENLLLPELRRAIEDRPDPDTDPTKLFRAILKVVSGQAPPPASAEVNDDALDEPQPAEDEELSRWIESVYHVLGENDPLVIEGQKLIAAKLRHWRLPLPPEYTSGDEGDVVFAEGPGNKPILPPKSPPDEKENPYYFVAPMYGEGHFIDYWFKYRTRSAFLEDVLYIPLAFALAQLRRRDFEAALYWFGQVYDFRKTPPGEAQGWANPRLELYFKRRRATDTKLESLDEWLDDTLNPHQIAATRTGADARFVILAIIRCLLDYADSEFARDTSESLARARELYETARQLLDSPQLGKEPAGCGDILTLISEVGEGHYRHILLPELERLPPSVDPGSLTDRERDRLLDQLLGALKPTDPPTPPAEVRQAVHDIIAGHFAPRAPKSVEKVRVDGKAALAAAHQRVLDEPKLFAHIQRVEAAAPGARSLRSAASDRPLLGDGKLHGDGYGRPRIPAPNEYQFCIPRNPQIALLRLRYEASWFKLNNCMNLAGLQRELPAYAAPTDTYSGLPVAEIGGQAGVTAATLVPTLYRYRTLIERARQLVAMAQQMEATYLSFLEKRDQEVYGILRARQDLGVARANVSLQDLRVTEAEHGKTLADRQFERAEAALTHYEELIAAGWSDGEKWAAGILIAAATVQSIAAIAGIIAGGFAGSTASNPVTIAAGAVAGATVGALADAQGAGAALATTSSIFAMFASFERREQEWNFQKDLAEIDQDIAKAQQTLAQDRHDITLQERRIAQLGAENASDVVTFLNAKFTNAELYAWMGGIVGDIYAYLLQEATTIARLAQRQLAFERQEPELAVVLDDYWTYTDAGAILRGGSATTDRRGMTGSARLLQDITRLDQEAFLTDRRKLQLSKTFSLALLDPIAFARFQESGVLPFFTTLEQFDRDFPGHYLRLIKRVRVSVIALVPPTEGIRATLESSGISQVVRGGPSFAETAITRQPESIAFTSPINATGLFELQEQPEMLLPFEGAGVASSDWTFSMPRAGNVVDYSTIADVLLTIEYTALDSAIYRGQVVQRLDRAASGERPFSFRQQFADCWYDLNNTDLLADDRPLRVVFETRRSDFPPNLADLRIEHVALFFVRQEGFGDEIQVESLLFTEAGHAGHVGGSASAKTGLISTRDANAGSWLPMQGKQPVGTWGLTLPKTDEARAWFKDGKITDILFVITFGGTTPAWP